ncbi:helix-turn-helix transcriptional regulator [Streptomyces sp. CA-181903]|uniref:helix-turn-helix transcriptional regulator n=1 Tax=Streptomyces sp. CA-181903 TaxID=3240055 RepID=UPI003D8EDC5C
MPHPCTTPHISAPHHLPAPETHSWYSTVELARFLNVDASTLRRWRTARPPQGPPFIRLSPRRVIYSTADVQQWLDQHRTDTSRSA